MKLIDLHKEWCKSERMSADGLCHSLDGLYREQLNDFIPNEIEREQLYKDQWSRVYWGAQDVGFNDKVHYGYSPLRQTIVLLICAMNNEL